MQGNQSSGQADDVEGAVVLFSAVDELADTVAAAILASSPQLDRDAVRRYMARVLLRTVARFAYRGDEAAVDDEDAVLADAVRDIGGWIDRLPADSGWAWAFGQCRDEITSVIGAA